MLYTYVVRLDTTKNLLKKLAKDSLSIVLASCIDPTIRRTVECFFACGPPSRLGGGARGDVVDVLLALPCALCLCVALPPIKLIFRSSFKIV